jgi:type VI secretion system protein VasJ
MWNWAVCGKHPSAKDYLELGAITPVTKAFADWIAKGYQGLAEKSNVFRDPFSWRFWAGGASNGLICGIVRDSADSIGRPYPLMVFGMGPLGDWSSQWQYVPCACEHTWNQMEFVSTRMFRDVKLLSSSIRTISPPQADWTSFTETELKIAGTEWAPVKEKISGKIMNAPGADLALFSLEEGPADEISATIYLWHTLIKPLRPEMPKAVFIGGNSQGTYLGICRRPLAPSDFVRLWSVSNVKGEGLSPLAQP